MSKPLHLPEKIRELFAVDCRSLALFRIFLSLLILADLAVRAVSLQVHYTDFGLLPRSALIDQFSPAWRIDLHLMSGTLAIQTVLFLAAGFLALMLLVGYRTRLATFLSWLMMISLHARNPMVLQAGDILFHLLLFWSLFLPLGAMWSLDRYRQSSPPKAVSSFCSMGTVGYFFQIAFVYWFTAAHKLAHNSFPIWWKEGSAVYYALSIDQFATPVAHFLLHFPALLKFLDYAVLLLEIFGPFFLFSPIATGLLRTLAVFAFIGLHLGFRLSLELGPFPFICSIGMLPFLPAYFWDTAQSFKILRSFGRNISEVVKRMMTPITRSPLVSAVPPRPGSSLPKPLWFAINGFAAFCLIYAFLWNIGNIFPKYAIPKKYQWFGIVFNLDQKWDMFSPPLRDDGWYVIPGKLRSGAVVDLFKKGAPVSWEKPKEVRAIYKNERWRKYMMNLWLEPNSPYRLYFGRYLCRDWNSRHPQDLQLQEFEIFFMRETTRPNYEPPQIAKTSIWKHWCYKIPDEVLHTQVIQRK